MKCPHCGKETRPKDRLCLWIVNHHHRFGTTPLTFWQKEKPTEEQCLAAMEDFDKGREWYEIQGPFKEKES